MKIKDIILIFSLMILFILNIIGWGLYFSSYYGYKFLNTQFYNYNPDSTCPAIITSGVINDNLCFKEGTVIQTRSKACSLNFTGQYSDRQHRINVLHDPETWGQLRIEYLNRFDQMVPFYLSYKDNIIIDGVATAMFKNPNQATVRSEQQEINQETVDIDKLYLGEAHFINDGQEVILWFGDERSNEFTESWQSVKLNKILNHEVNSL